MYVMYVPVHVVIDCYSWQPDTKAMFNTKTHHLHSISFNFCCSSFFSCRQALLIFGRRFSSFFTVLCNFHVSNLFFHIFFFFLPDFGVAHCTNTSHIRQIEHVLATARAGFILQQPLSNALGVKAVLAFGHIGPGNIITNAEMVKAYMTWIESIRIVIR